MYVKAKSMATAGLLVAFTVVMLMLSSAIESNSLFFIAAASFCVGIAVREWKLKLGFAFLVASIVSNLLFAPNKLYCVTYAGMALYIWVGELLWEKIADAKELNHRTFRLWIGKYLVFNLMYIPALFLMPTLLFTKEVTGWWLIILLLAGQVALFVYEVAYEYFQSSIWGKLRTRLMD